MSFDSRALWVKEGGRKHRIQMQILFSSVGGLLWGWVWLFGKLDS